MKYPEMHRIEHTHAHAHTDTYRNPGMVDKLFNGESLIRLSFQETSDQVLCWVVCR